MSLTSLVRTDCPVRDRIAAYCPKPRLQLLAELRVPSEAPNAALIGIAYDYLLRFHLQKTFPFAITKRWIAEASYEELRSSGDAGASIWTGEKWLPSAAVRDRMAVLIKRARKQLAEFIAGEPLSMSLIQAAVNLAHCDLYFRAGRLDKRFGQPTQQQVKELGRLIDATDWTAFRPNKICYLNPAFGDGSKWVGGADADLLIDDLLIDVKTSSKLRVRAEDWRQLIGYVALNEFSPIGGGKTPVAIRRVGFYFARYGYLASWALSEVVNVFSLQHFSSWFHLYAKKLHKKRMAFLAQTERTDDRRMDQEKIRQKPARRTPTRRKPSTVAVRSRSAAKQVSSRHQATRRRRATKHGM